MHMSVDLGTVSILGAEAVGQPGQRRFRLFVRNARGSAVMWMEKEQLNSLALTIDRFLAQLTEGQVLRIEAQAGGFHSSSTMPADFPTVPDYELQVGRFILGYDEPHKTFLLSAVPMEVRMELGQEPELLLREEDAVTFGFTQHQAQNLTITVTSVVSGGRPVCPLCRTPLDGGPHACVKQNGHREILQIQRDQDDDEEEE